MVVIGLIGDSIDFMEEEHGLELDFGNVGGHGLGEEEVEHEVVDKEEEVEHGVLIEVGLEQLVLDEEVEHGTVDEEEVKHGVLVEEDCEQLVEEDVKHGGVDEVEFKETTVQEVENWGVVEVEQLQEVELDEVRVLM